MANVKVWINRDIKGTYYVSGTYLEDGKESDSPYPKNYLLLKRKLDNIFPHMTLSKIKSHIKSEGKKLGYTTTISV